MCQRQNANAGNCFSFYFFYFLFRAVIGSANHSFTKEKENAVDLLLIRDTNDPNDPGSYSQCRCEIVKIILRFFTFECSKYLPSRYRPTDESNFIYPLFDCTEHWQQSTLYLRDGPAVADWILFRVCFRCVARTRNRNRNAAYGPLLAPLRVHTTLWTSLGVWYRWRCVYIAGRLRCAHTTSVHAYERHRYPWQHVSLIEIYGNSQIEFIWKHSTSQYTISKSTRKMFRCGNVFIRFVCVFVWCQKPNFAAWDPFFRWRSTARRIIR